MNKNLLMNEYKSEDKIPKRGHFVCGCFSFSFKLLQAPISHLQMGQKRKQISKQKANLGMDYP